MPLKAYKLAGAAILCATTFISTAARAGSFSEKPRFKVEKVNKGFSVQYGWASLGDKPLNCTVYVRVRYSSMGDKYKKGTSDELFKLTGEAHDTGTGYGEFDHKSDLDNVDLAEVSLDPAYCY